MHTASFLTNGIGLARNLGGRGSISRSPSSLGTPFVGATRKADRIKPTFPKYVISLLIVEEVYLLLT